MSERDRDVLGVAIPRPEIRLVARIGTCARNGLDVHALGVRNTVHRKLLHRGQRAVATRLPLGTSHGVLGVPASALAGRIVAIEDLWTRSDAQQLYERLAAAPDLPAVSAVLDGAVAARLAGAQAGDRSTQLTLDVTARLAEANLRSIAAELGVSERHVRRVFHETVGVIPKAYAKLARFDRALRAARKQSTPSWASIAASAGYYDQAHMIAEFRAISGVTPRALWHELAASPAIG
jgi:AraC-like DNA-binding protein